MKIVPLILAVCFLPLHDSLAETPRERVTKLVDSIIPEGWHRFDGIDRIWLALPNVRVDSAISGINDNWSKIPPSPYLIEIRFTELISLAEYQMILDLQDQIISRRESEADKNTKGYSYIPADVRDSIKAPLCYDRNESIWLHVTHDFPSAITKPAAAIDVADKVREALLGAFTPYVKQRP